MQTSSYFTLLAITANSAIDSARLCYRKGRLDCYRIHALLTHPTTVKAAKIAVWTLYIGAVIAFALGQTARIIVQSWVDAEVACALVQPQVEATQLEPQAEPDPFEVAAPHLERVPALAATITAPVAVVKVPVAQSLTVASLQKQCTAAGIRWRNAGGKGKPITKNPMLAALKVIAVEVVS